MSKPILQTIVMHVILLIVLIGTITLVFDLGRFAFLGELIVLGGLLLIGLVAVLGLANYHSWSWRLLTGFFILIFLNLAFLYMISNKLDMYAFNMVFYASIVGFFISVFTRPHVTDHDQNEEEPITNSNYPGKYVASENGKVYYEASNERIKRIASKNRVWYQNKADAKKDGKKPHSSVN